MSFKLSKADDKRRDGFVAELEIKGGKLSQAISEFNAAMQEAWSKVEAAQTEYNELLGEISEFRDEIVSERQGEWDDKSEKWQEGERGEAAQSWITAWENIDFSEVDISQPDELEEPDLAHRDELENAPLGADDV